MLDVAVVLRTGFGFGFGRARGEAAGRSAQGGGSRGAKRRQASTSDDPRSARAGARWGVWDCSAVDRGRRGQRAGGLLVGSGASAWSVDRGGEGSPGGIEEGLVEQLDQVVALEVDHQHEGLHDGEPLEKVDVLYDGPSTSSRPGSCITMSSKTS